MCISLVERAAPFSQRRIDLRISKVPRRYAMSQLSSIRRLELYHPRLRLSRRVWYLQGSSRSRRQFELVAVVFVVISETDMITRNSDGEAWPLPFSERAYCQSGSCRQAADLAWQVCIVCLYLLYHY